VLSTIESTCPSGSIAIEAVSTSTSTSTSIRAAIGGGIVTTTATITTEATITAAATVTAEATTAVATITAEAATAVTTITAEATTAVTTITAIATTAVATITAEPTTAVATITAITAAIRQTTLVVRADDIAAFDDRCEAAHTTPTGLTAAATIPAPRAITTNRISGSVAAIRKTQITGERGRREC
jgi:hypothetical protein